MNNITKEITEQPYDRNTVAKQIAVRIVTELMDRNPSFSATNAWITVATDGVPWGSKTIEKSMLATLAYEYSVRIWGDVRREVMQRLSEEAA